MKSNYDKQPYVEVPSGAGRCVSGWAAVCAKLETVVADRRAIRTVMTVECYTGVLEDEIVVAMQSLGAIKIVRSAEAFLSKGEIDAKVAPLNGGDDPVFGCMNHLQMGDLMDPRKIDQLAEEIEQAESCLVVVLGSGASLIHPGDILVYADLARWEAQLRMRRDEISNLGIDNHDLKWSLQYKRAYFTDWRVCDRLKRDLMARWDFVLDTNQPDEPRMADGEAVREGLKEATRRPFRVVPFFDPAPWGGQWIKEACDMDRSAKNYGWGFDCVPEENSLLLKFGETLMELPSIDVVFQEPRALLGDKVYARFGDEFPIRFDFLDTIEGGNLSFQVHPLAEYIQHHFGMNYTQDESYYYLDAAEDATMYLGTKAGIDPEAMMEDLRSAQRGEKHFDDSAYVNCLPAKKHDHFLIPAGTVHCGGGGGMVLEISATPYIFTFKMWDWGRLGLDGLPRPINVERGGENIVWERDEQWVKENLVNQVEPLDSGEGWREERTGLHELEFIETRRHWFTDTVPHDTQGGVNVLNLVEGREVIVESPTDAFEPFVVHYAETFIVPAAVGAYTIRPHGESVGEECATLKAYVRT
ncbi:class I mannose-6-phosphate isomerase [Verrucomicrobiaceae bacterium N1E253]|uniref:Class I mannose-6-phosphate isomerase n=2 Tax=Oceaniferula marina TaxID=2748318 RepID=A0A851GKF3_9BACT|nr:class I mannose-6-phosphate isomerase [Oceaniferula marina]